MCARVAAVCAVARGDRTVDAKFIVAGLPATRPTVVVALLVPMFVQWLSSSKEKPPVVDTVRHFLLQNIL